MNRRTSIKSILALSVISVSSFSVYEWLKYNHKIDFKLLTQKKKTIAELAETIIPRTDTPGAKDAKVEEFILGTLEFCCDQKTQNIFYIGLLDLEKYASNTYNREFINCSKVEKINILQHFEDKAVYHTAVLNKINDKLLGKPFIVKLKELTIDGYCTSQLGATQGLAYDFIPSTFQACIPLGRNQHSWATK